MMRVRVVGPESAGKTTLAMALARYFRCRFVPEFARSWLESRAAGSVTAAITLADLTDIAAGQAALEDETASWGGNLLICDTDPLSTSLWSEALVGLPLPGREGEAGLLRRYGLTLLMSPAPWVPDPVRYQPDPEARAVFFVRCRQVYPDAYLLDGGWDARFSAAVEAINRARRTPDGQG